MWLIIVHITLLCYMYDNVVKAISNGKSLGDFAPTFPDLSPSKVTCSVLPPEALERAELGTSSGSWSPKGPLVRS